MRSKTKELMIDEIFKGISKEELKVVKSLLPVSTTNEEHLCILISKLSPEDQWIIDNYLEKAIRLQRTKYYLKKALVISLFIVGTLLISMLLILILPIRGDHI